MFDLNEDSTFNPAFITASGGRRQAMNALLSALHDGKTYLSVQTTAYAGGEFRGFLLQVPGDYNDNGIVDAADYVLWRNSENETGEGLQADSNDDNAINGTDYTEWRRLFGNARGDGHHHREGGTAVPEPSTIVLLIVSTLALTNRLRLS